MSAQTVRPDDVRQLLVRTSFGSPLPLSDELLSASKQPFKTFMKRPDKAPYLRFCEESNLPKTAPYIVDVEKYLVSSEHDYSKAEIELFRASGSYKLLHSRLSVRALNLPVMAIPEYVDVTLGLGDWVLERGSKEALAAPDEYDETVVASCSDGISGLVIERYVNIRDDRQSPKYPGRHDNVLRSLPMSVLSFVAARQPRALRSVYQLSNRLGDNHFARPSEYDIPTIKLADKVFRPLAGDAWLAWLLLFGGRKFNGDWQRSFAQLRQFAAEAMPIVSELGDFDTVAPYFEAGLSLDTIKLAVENDVSIDVALSIEDGAVR